MRCYVARRPNGRFVAVCLQPNLVVEARSQHEAKQQLETLIEAYIESATRDGELVHFMSQRAPVRFYIEYWFGRIKNQFRRLNFHFRPFTETCKIRL
jgi:hypothetical protein